jgi:amino acid permease
MFLVLILSLSCLCLSVLIHCLSVNVSKLKPRQFKPRHVTVYPVSVLSLGGSDSVFLFIICL